MKIVKWLDEHFEEYLMVLFLVLITCVMMLQVVIRKIPFIPSLQWAEEFCRFMWIMSVFVSLPYTIRKGNMLRVSVLLDALPHAVRKTVNIIVDVINLVCMAILAYNSVGVVTKIAASGEASPAMLWPMWTVYIFMLFGFALASIRCVQQIVLHIMTFGEHDLSTIEQTMADAAEEAAAAGAGTAATAENEGGKA